MSQLPAFRELQNFIGEQTARKPHRTEPKPETANQLTQRIVKHVRANGGYATRQQSTGTYRDDLKKYVPSQQRAGMPDVFCIVEGRAVLVEIKAGKDKLSAVQKQTIADLERAGAWVYIAHTFEGFQEWFTAQFLTPPF
ncbi:VRR-NUC domain-containing protein [Spirosoma sp. HMF3257]|uniref:VRR-NUC domain-containing protein n=1 Tax=Spirosoma telluris TaxID=2183553 RepID=A0A327NQW1_9BACT|nr:VRR-NUC domain-containing protein [Spirosoma telluris]RAI76829.1 VRR-NUC domain-containing protein [Spirosoma telluris]